MRIHLKLTPNSTSVPFNYQQSLVSCFHRWMGENELHNDTSMYTLSWLQGGKINNHGNGLDFKQGASFFISAASWGLLQQLIAGMGEGAHVGWGMHVKEVKMEWTPKFGKKQRFFTSSPIFIQRDKENEDGKRYFFYSDAIADELLTQTLQTKLMKAGKTTDVSVKFDRSYPSPKTRKIIFKQFDLRASVCPVIVSGHPAAVAFAWDVGVGNCTGIGFGALQ